MVETLRTCAHKLTIPVTDDPVQLVSYMGAVQGQDLEMCKWAVGMRLTKPSLSAVCDAIDSARIIRLHIMRPTWHLVAAEDVRWMLSTNATRLRSTYMSYWGKRWDIGESDIARFHDVGARVLSGTDGLTMQEVTAALNEAGESWNIDQVKMMLTVGEVEGFICNGLQRGRKNTYALLDERVAATPEISREEALARLAAAYFRSHSPASKEDFEWWSGLSGTEARAAMESIRGELIADRYEGQKLFVHTSLGEGGAVGDEVHLLPPYDEYLIAYRDRSHVLDPTHTAKAHNSFGIFHPVIMHRGRIVGNWKKLTKKGSTQIETTFFDKTVTPSKSQITSAIDRYLAFLQS
jgi:uncharacterized protein YcaQ